MFIVIVKQLVLSSHLLFKCHFYWQLKTGLTVFHNNENTSYDNLSKISLWQRSRCVCGQNLRWNLISQREQHFWLKRPIAIAHMDTRDWTQTILVGSQPFYHLVVEQFLFLFLKVCCFSKKEIDVLCKSWGWWCYFHCWNLHARKLNIGHSFIFISRWFILLHCVIVLPVHRIVMEKLLLPSAPWWRFPRSNCTLYCSCSYLTCNRV